LVKPNGRWIHKTVRFYPTDFVELATKLERPSHPPGRDVRCIVSVAMLTEGWDCTTVTHIIGLRPFMSQLLCEQVVGRGLRRTNYDPADLIDGKFPEEVAKVYGVPFEVIPFKTNTNGPRPPPVKRWHIHAVSPERDNLEIRFPRVEGYTYAVRNRITVDWGQLPTRCARSEQNSAGSRSKRAERNQPRPVVFKRSWKSRPREASGVPRQA